MASLAEIRARIQAQDNKTTKGSGTQADNAIYALLKHAAAHVFLHTTCRRLQHTMLDSDQFIARLSSAPQVHSSS